MHDEVIRLGDEYVGVFVVSGSRDAPSIWPPVTGAQFWAFETAGAAYGFVLGGQHPEPVTAWLRATHALQVGTSMLAVTVRGGRPIPSDYDNYLFVFSLAELIAADEISQVLTSDRFLLFLPHTDEILLLTSAADGLDLSRRLNARQARPITGLVRTAHVAVPASARPRSGAPYDPLESQIREVLGPATQNTSDALDNLARAWSANIGSVVPPEIRKSSESLRSRAAAIVQRLKAGREDDALLAQVDVLAQELQWVARRSRSLQDRLVDYRPIATVPEDVRTYEDHAGTLMLRAVGRYCHDVASRMNVASDATVLPVFGDAYTITPLQFERADRRPLADATTFVLEFQSSSRTRLGAVPIVAHELAHLLADTSADATTQVEEALFHDEALKPLFKQYLERYSNNESDSEAAWRRMQWRSMSWAKELAADVLATVAVGPSYLYAFSRFALGTLGDIRREDVFSHAETHPPIGLRLRSCAAVARLLFLDTKFSSRFLPESGPTLPLEVLKNLAALVRDPFRTPPETLDTIMADLRAGQIAQARPTEILAALWRAVANKTGYVNEIGALVSVAKA